MIFWAHPNPYGDLILTKVSARFFSAPKSAGDLIWSRMVYLKSVISH